MRPESHERHILLYGANPKCAICDIILDDNEKIVALAGNKSTTALERGFIDPFAASRDENYTGSVWDRPPAHKALVDEKWRLCRVPEHDCHAFHGSQARRYGCGMHVGCFQVFFRHSASSTDCGDDGAGNGIGAEMLDRLWQACVWARVPWTGARVPELGLARRSIWEFLGAFVACAARCRVEWLGELPEPVVVSIMEMVPRDDEFWRCVAAVDMARRLAAQERRRLRTVPLSWLASWERGEAPVLATEEEQEAGLARAVRLTVDGDGVRKFERLATRPAFTRERYDDKAFVIEEESRFGVAVVHFKDDRLLLAMLDDMEEPGFDVWNTPTPPDLSRCPVRPVRKDSAMRYHTIDLKSITGLTFLRTGRRIIGIHAHSRRRPCAMETLQTLAKSHQRDEKYLHWLYIPLPRQDTVLSCGPLVDRCNISSESGRQNMMFRTRLSGEFTVSRYRPSWHHAENNPDETASYSFLLHDLKHPHSTLIYSNGFSRSGRGATLVVPYPDPDGQEQVVTAPILAEPEHYPLPSNHEYWEYSEAPLENVRRAHVYYYDGASDGDNQHLPGTGSVAGLLFFYRNGGQRALGECRIGADPFVPFEDPQTIVIAHLNEGGGRRGVKIWFEGPGPAGEDREEWYPAGWSRYEMEGRLEFWFNYSQAWVKIIGGRAVEEEAEGGDEEGTSSDMD